MHSFITALKEPEKIFESVFSSSNAKDASKCSGNSKCSGKKGKVSSRGSSHQTQLPPPQDKQRQFLPDCVALYEQLRTSRRQELASTWFDAFAAKLTAASEAANWGDASLYTQQRKRGRGGGGGGGEGSSQGQKRARLLEGKGACGEDAPAEKVDNSITLRCRFAGCLGDLEQAGVVQLHRSGKSKSASSSNIRGTLGGNAPGSVVVTRQMYTWM